MNELTLVRLALLSQLARSLDGRLGPVLVQVIIRHDFTTHELLFEVRARMNRLDMYSEKMWEGELTG